ncbi:Rap1a/Tai family immunity protein [Phyllobacterium bourgognense]|uniref:Rap1a immunity protein domain-containing protein n=1 Tax=Phyllobacterium bourgognense TaxID=314236 RepID=A0A368Z7X4_9HYPH|nr:Rap1a/Tai family immunity protein [Phyllobacterium bourgognense]RCW87596.1 hypothetical protein C7476_101362 [Phyllobacterium bourgognense]
MSRFLLIAAMVAASVLPAKATPPYYRGNDLARVCGEPRGSDEACVYYILGAYDGFEEARRQKGLKPCINEAVHANDMAAVVRGYLAAHYREYELPAAVIVAVAFKGAFCPEK